MSQPAREFIELTNQLRSNAVTDTATPQLIQSFLAGAESQRKLPDGIAGDEVIDAFLHNLVWLMTDQLHQEGKHRQPQQQRQDVARRGLDLLNTYIHSDPRCWERFNPSRAMLDRMNIGQYIAGEDTSLDKVNSLIDMCLMILEKNDNLDYFNFTDNDRMAWRMNSRKNERMHAKTRGLEASMRELHHGLAQARETHRLAVEEFVLLTAQQAAEAKALIETTRREDADVLELRAQLAGLSTRTNKAVSDLEARDHQLKMVTRDFQDVNERQLVNEHEI